MEFYQVEVKETEVYHIPVQATSHKEAISLTYKVLKEQRKETYWVSSQKEVNILGELE